MRREAQAIWQAAVDAARPQRLVQAAFADSASSLSSLVRAAPRVLVIGAGKAGAAMSAAVEDCLPDCLDRMDGLVNVPAEILRPLRAIRLHAARPAGANEPTEQGVIGADRILQLAREAGPQDIALCLLSGGASALLPAPVPSVSLQDKQLITRLLHACGATINEMNTVRKHLSRIKGGRLARAFAGAALFSLIVSDVVGDPLDVIASGPTSPDPSTFAEALAVLDKFSLLNKGVQDPYQACPPSVMEYLRQGAAGAVPETPKSLPPTVRNIIIGNNPRSLAAAHAKANEAGYRTLNLGSCIEGESRQVATVMAGIVRSIRWHGLPVPAPVCLLSGGETTVTLARNHGLGGRNQEFALAFISELGQEGLQDVTVLSGGTDGEDGPTDAAGAWADETTLRKAATLCLDPSEFLKRNDSYHFFEKTGDLLNIGLTETNVMDIRVILVR
jgi:hydroxypyruvate reductase/glycerate 2-kinase